MRDYFFLASNVLACGSKGAFKSPSLPLLLFDLWDCLTAASFSSLESRASVAFRLEKAEIMVPLALAAS